MLSQMLEKRNLPELMTAFDGTKITSAAQWPARRKELIHLLSEQVYGFTPAAPDHVDVEILSTDDDAYAGTAIHRKLSLSFPTPKGTFSFPVDYLLPKSDKKVPLFISINFRPDFPDKYIPAEEISDHGYAIMNFYYNDVTTDNTEPTGLFTHYPREEKTAWGKIGMWAFAASRILDYALTLDEIDHVRVAVIGHSRLGKTALWCSAQDDRFALGISNDSGSSGAAISRDKIGESVEVISRVFPHWFCGNYRAWADREHEMPFDQHMLLAASAPRRLCVGSAEKDDWADPTSEFLSALAASPAYELHGLTGLVTPDELPAVGSALPEGHIGYQLRAGTHFLSRADWLRYIEYRNLHNV